MKKFEYSVYEDIIEDFHDSLDDALELYLRRKGDRGWELVQLKLVRELGRNSFDREEYKYSFIFKREYE